MEKVNIKIRMNFSKGSKFGKVSKRNKGKRTSLR